MMDYGDERGLRRQAVACIHLTLAGENRPCVSGSRRECREAEENQQKSAAPAALWNGLASVE